MAVENLPTFARIDAYRYDGAIRFRDAQTREILAVGIYVSENPLRGYGEWLLFPGFETAKEVYHRKTAAYDGPLVQAATKLELAEKLRDFRVADDRARRGVEAELLLAEKAGEIVEFVTGAYRSLGDPRLLGDDDWQTLAATVSEYNRTKDEADALRS